MTKTRLDTLTVKEGRIEIKYPATLSIGSYQDLTEWLDMWMRRLGRSIPVAVHMQTITMEPKSKKT